MRDESASGRSPDAAPPAEAAPPVEPKPRAAFGPRWAVVGIFLLLSIQAMAYARNFLMPVVLGLLLTLVFSPLRRFLGRIGIPAGIAAFLIVGSLLAALVLGILTLAVPVSNWVDNAPEIGRQVQEKLRDLRGAAEGVRQAAEQVDAITSGGTTASAPGAQAVVVADQGNAAAIALATPAVLAQVMFTLVLLFFLLSSGDMFYEKLVHVMPTFQDKRRAVRIAYDIERKLSRYLFTITLINAGLGIAIGLAMWWLGMPSPLLLGVIGFLFNFIPYVGAIFGVLIALSVGLVSLDGARDAFVAGGTYFVLTSIEGQFVTPYFVGRSLRLNTVVVFLSVTLWAWLWSVVGMLVATPLLVTIRTLCEHIPALEAFGDFLSARGVETEDEDDGNGNGGKRKT